MISLSFCLSLPIYGSAFQINKNFFKRGSGYKGTPDRITECPLGTENLQPNPPSPLVDCNSFPGRHMSSTDQCFSLLWRGKEPPCSAQPSMALPGRPAASHPGGGYPIGPHAGRQAGRSAGPGAQQFMEGEVGRVSPVPVPNCTKLAFVYLYVLIDPFVS